MHMRDVHSFHAEDYKKNLPNSFSTFYCETIIFMQKLCNLDK